MDGDLDCSQLSRAQLEEALARIDKSKYPVDYHRMLLELDRRPPESPQARPAPSMVALIARYSLFFVFGYLFLIFLSILGVMRSAVIASAVTTVAMLGLFLHLAWRHPIPYVRAAIGVAVTGSALCAAIDAVGTTSKPIKVFVATLALSFATASLAGTLHGTMQLKPPANNRWRGP